jgi:hypothetical protein
MEFRQFTLRASMAVLVLVAIGLNTVPQAECRPSITDGWLQYHNRFGITNGRRASNECADVVSYHSYKSLRNIRENSLCDYARLDIPN